MRYKVDYELSVMQKEAIIGYLRKLAQHSHGRPKGMSTRWPGRDSNPEGISVCPECTPNALLLTKEHGPGNSVLILLLLFENLPNPASAVP
jgi:hypothetical protein